jgi:hypothetical protein
LGIFITYSVLLQVIGEVSNHDLSLGGDTILGGTALLALTRVGLLVGITLLGCKCLVRSLGERNNLARHVRRRAVGRSLALGELDAVSAVGLLFGSVSQFRNVYTSSWRRYSRLLRRTFDFAIVHYICRNHR